MADINSKCRNANILKLSFSHWLIWKYCVSGPGRQFLRITRRDFAVNSFVGVRVHVRVLSKVHISAKKHLHLEHVYHGE